MPPGQRAHPRAGLGPRAQAGSRRSTLPEALEAVSKPQIAFIRIARSLNRDLMTRDFKIKRITNVGRQERTKKKPAGLFFKA
jgi:hypothetical protein